VTRSLLVLFAALWLLVPMTARAEDEPPVRAAEFSWDASGQYIYADFSLSDVVDAEIERKLSRGLPTTIVFTGLVFRVGSNTPVSSTLHSCRVTWHVWEEMYRVEVTRTNERTARRHWSPTVEGVLRRCVRIQGLLIADHNQLQKGTKIFLRGQVEVNPISPELLSKIRRWVSRPASTQTVTPGHALFSTFTGLFMKRVDGAERSLMIRTRTGPIKEPPPPPKENQEAPKGGESRG
jgi:hypothetical protein